MSYQIGSSHCFYLVTAPLNFARMNVVVKDLTVTVSDKNKLENTLLDAISFTVLSADVVALMGPSGAGKTTMLNRLVGRGITGRVKGSIMYNGQGLEQMRTSMGYVTQDDIMYEVLTPRENLNFAAEFLQKNSKPADRRASVDEVMQKLRLMKCADTVVGTPGLTKGISGGERKRTNVALSLLGKPSMLLLDEPTSGLDSKMSLELTTDLRAIAQQGCTVISTIHQPSEAVFDNFSKVLLLQSGRMSYFGPVKGLRAQLVMGLGLAIKESTPLPDLLLDILSEENQIAKFRELSNESVAEGELASPVQPDLRCSERISFCGQLCILFRRNVLVIARTKSLTVVRIMQTVLSTLLISWIFNQLEHNLAGVRARMFVTFLLGFAQFLFALMGVVNTFPAQRAVFLREVQDRWYNPAAFYIAQVIVDTFVQSLFPILTTLLSIWIIGLNDSSAAHVLNFYVITAVASNVGAAMGFIVSAAVSSVSTALSIAPGFLMPQLLLCGLFIDVEKLPLPFQLMSHLAAARYLLQGVVSNEFNCDTDAVCTQTWRTSPGSKCGDSPCNFCCSETEMKISQGICPVLTCDDALQFLGLDADSIWPSGEKAGSTVLYNILAMLCLLVLFRLHGMIVLMVSYKRASRSG